MRTVACEKSNYVCMALNGNAFSLISPPQFELVLSLNTCWLALRVLFEATLETSVRNPRAIPYSSYQFGRWDEKMHSQTELDRPTFSSEELGGYVWRESCRALKDGTGGLYQEAIPQKMDEPQPFEIEVWVMQAK